MNTFTMTLLSVIFFYVLVPCSIYAYKRNLKRSIEKALLASRNKILQGATTLNFEKDVEFLSFIIETKLSNAKKLLIEPMFLTHKRAYINDNTLNQHVETVTIDIISMLNDNYRVVLYRYFTDDSLNSFVAETVFLSLTVALSELNKQRTKKMYIKK